MTASGGRARVRPSPALVLAVAVLAALGLSGSASGDPAPGKDVCMDGGWEALGFRNQGQCVAAANAAAKAGRPFPPDRTPPETKIVSRPPEQTAEPLATFAFSSNEAGSRFECRIDGAPFESCSSPHTTAPLGEGPHVFEVRAIDRAGNVDPTPASWAFSVHFAARLDTTPPDTVIIAGPSGTSHNATPTFAFVSTKPGSRFECSIDGGPFFPCASPFTTPPLSPGPHTFEVRAIDAAGNVDPSPASSTNPTAARRSFTVLATALAPPVLGRAINAEPLSGEVLVSVPGQAGGAGDSVPGLEGQRFVPLSEARQLPVGTVFDTRRGTVRLTSARNARGATQTAEFLAGVFDVRQSRRRSAKGLTRLRRRGASFRACAARRSGGRALRAEASRRASRRTIRRLRGRGRGRFSTRGRYSSATVRGTDWTVSDRCDGTLTTVRQGKVAVRDIGRRKTVLLRAGKRYLARRR